MSDQWTASNPPSARKLTLPAPEDFGFALGRTRETEGVLIAVAAAKTPFVHFADAALIHGPLYAVAFSLLCLRNSVNTALRCTSVNERNF